MTSNDKVLSSMFFLLAIGVSCGAFFEVSMEGAGKEQLTSLISLMFAGDSTADFFQGLLKSILNWFVLLIIPFSVIYLKPLVLLCPFVPLAKGIALGFSATMLIEVFGAKGSIYIIMTLLPQSIIQVPALCYLTALSVISVKGQNKKALRQDARPYYLSYCIGCGIIFISCLLEAFLMQLVL